MSTGHIQTRGPNTWRLKYDIGRDPITGKRITKFKTVHGGKRDAQRELRELLGAVDKGQHVDPGKLTLGAYLDGWLEGRGHALAPKTAERYADHIRDHIKPEIGHIREAYGARHQRLLRPDVEIRPSGRQGWVGAPNGLALRPIAP